MLESIFYTLYQIYSNIHISNTSPLKTTCVFRFTPDLVFLDAFAALRCPSMMATGCRTASAVASYATFFFVVLEGADGFNVETGWLMFDGWKHVFSKLKQLLTLNWNGWSIPWNCFRMFYRCFCVMFTFPFDQPFRGYVFSKCLKQSKLMFSLETPNAKKRWILLRIPQWHMIHVWIILTAKWRFHDSTAMKQWRQNDLMTPISFGWGTDSSLKWIGNCLFTSLTEIQPWCFHRKLDVMYFNYGQITWNLHMGNT